MRSIGREQFESECMKRAGFDSVNQISHYSRKKFINKYAPLFTELNREDARKLAGEIHQRAQSSMGTLVNQHVDHQQRLSPYYRNLRFANLALPAQSSVGGDGPDPSYEGQFGELEVTGVDPDRSVLSPAAYLADLVWMADQHIHKKEGDHAATGLLDQRRPDIKTIPLDRANTHALVSKLDIVNDVLIRQLGDGFKSVDLASLSYPFNLPYHQPLDDIRTSLKQSHSSLPQLWLGLIEEPTEVERQSIARETLGLSPEQWSMVSTPDTTEEHLKQCYGLTESDGLSDLKDAGMFKRQAGLTDGELEALLYQDLTEKELESQLNQSFFINQGQEAPIELDDGQLTFANDLTALDFKALDFKALDRLHRFIRLAKWLGWSFSDLDWALRSSYCATGNGALEGYEISAKLLPLLAWIKTVEQAGVLTLNQACAWLYRIKDYGRQALCELAEMLVRLDQGTGQWVEGLATDKESRLNRDMFMEHLKSLDPQQSLPGLLQLSPRELQKIADVVGPLDTPLDLERLSILYRFSLLPVMTGLSLTDCMIVYGLLRADNPEVDYNEQLLLQVLFEERDDGCGLLNLINQLSAGVLWFSHQPMAIHRVQYWLTGNSGDINLQNRVGGIASLVNNTQAIRSGLLKSKLTRDHFEANTPALQQFYLSSSDSGLKALKDFIDNHQAEVESQLTQMGVTIESVRAMVDELEDADSEGFTVADVNPVWLFVSGIYLNKQGIFEAVPEEQAFKQGLQQFLQFLKADLSQEVVDQCWAVTSRYCQAQCHLLSQQLSALINTLPHQLEALCLWLKVVPSDFIFDPAAINDQGLKSWPPVFGLLDKLLRYGDLVNACSLSPEEIVALWQHPEYFVSSPAPFNFGSSSN